MIRVFVSNLMMLREWKRFEEELISRGCEPIFPEVDQFLKEDELLKVAGTFDGWLAGDDEITRLVLEKCLPRLKVISKWGTGLDSIDLKAAKDLGVPVKNSPGAFKDAVAEVAIGYMLSVTRNIADIDKAVRKGTWPKPQGLGLTGRRLGIIGMGAIGKGIAERALAMKMDVCGYDPYPFQASFVSAVSLDELISGSDIICLSCNLSKENFHLINAETIGKMINGVTIINVARGGLIDESALIDGLKSGKVAGAGLDVYEHEPLPLDSPLRDLSGVVLGSHNANSLTSTIEEVHTNTLNNLFAEL